MFITSFHSRRNMNVPLEKNENIDEVSFTMTPNIRNRKNSPSFLIISIAVIELNVIDFLNYQSM